ncbi:hypothetical protein TWF506_004352 [Arthrobotrys conoides]|uniref:C3H1-type domain-containing protein n=1 Tax=Arthrobotrys conoides TaxID=74498 RepID=A0AAN8N6L5_9PEZI
MAHLHQHHHLIHHHSSHELIHSPPSSVSSSAMASTVTLPQQQASHAHQLHQQASNPHLQRQESTSSLQQLTMPIGSPPDQLQYSAQQNGRPVDHRRMSSGNQHTLSGLSALQNGEMNGLQINGANGQSQQFGGQVPPFDPARSPPNKNLAHVPCKFFRQNQCQAGRSCPFSHSMDPTTESAPCKYFQKGNCKFGAKCANAHILPDGRRINRSSFNNGNQIPLGGRIAPEYNNHGPRSSALSMSIVQHPFAVSQGFSQYDGSVEQQNGYDIGYGPGVTYDSAFGSPREENGLPLSPLATSHRTLGPLDAGLPASLDSNGISYFAKYGPIAASVPSKFGMESPPASLPQNSALQSLRRSAYADDAESNEPSRSRRSPPLQPDETSFSQRLLQRNLGRNKFPMSSSLPRPIGHMISDDSPFDNSEGEDLVPASLLADVLGERGKEIKNRRMSRPDHDDAMVGSWHRRNNTAPNTPGEPTSAVGSPGSRFGPLFSRRGRDEDSPISAIGHVGSPLRNSYAQKPSPPFGPIGRPQESMDGGSFIASPTRPGLSLSRGSLLSATVPRTPSTQIPDRRGPPSSSIAEEDLFQIDDVVEASSKKTGQNNSKLSGLGLDLPPHGDSLHGQFLHF